MACLGVFLRRLLEGSGGEESMTVSAASTTSSAPTTSNLALVDKTKSDRQLERSETWDDAATTAAPSCCGSSSCGEVLSHAVCLGLCLEGLEAHDAEGQAIAVTLKEEEEEAQTQRGLATLQPLRLELCEGLFFFAAPLAPAADPAGDSERPQPVPLVAEAAEISLVGIRRILGPQSCCSTNSRSGRGGGEGDCSRVESAQRAVELPQPATDASRASAEPEDLLVSCRSALADGPKMVKLIGARLCRGRIARLIVEGGGASIAAVVNPALLVCEIEHRHGSSERVSLVEAVAAVREAQRRQDEAALEVYHRKLCSKSMSGDRRRLLGLC